MRKLALLFFALLVLVACGKKLDDEAMNDLASALEARWEYTDTLPNEVTVGELEKAVEIELDNLNKYDPKELSKSGIYSLYSNYIADLKLISNLMYGKEATDPVFKRDWNNHQDKRKVTLYEINEIQNIEVSEKHKDVLKELLLEGKELQPKIERYEYIYQMTYRFYEAISYPNGSFEQKSSLNAAEGRVDSVIEEVREKYDDEALVDLFEELRITVKAAVDEGLNGKFIMLEIFEEMVDEEVENIKKY